MTIEPVEPTASSHSQNPNSQSYDALADQYNTLKDSWQESLRSSQNDSSASTQNNHTENTQNLSDFLNSGQGQALYDQTKERQANSGMDSTEFKQCFNSVLNNMHALLVPGDKNSTGSDSTGSTTTSNSEEVSENADSLGSTMDSLRDNPK